ncbi:hypothetical protein KY290_000711 [Solanum tuberosum]|uniref:Retrovirus-related Pol polyprotein from transposon TNT 1-94-like beta-barrel domain-containing protein n=1 Tax=Solanum tuberosum TaxID=4113 RepID=A0ABQ7WK83_SOLTU|nr:hypothetical protein KY289_000764 [Solanum tuberosum]KAH0781113.1 hypothetical protein KY290_000711 [Solanum tuberosum]
MTTKFKYIVCSIEESKDVDTLSIDELQGPCWNRGRRSNFVETKEDREIKEEEEEEEVSLLMAYTSNGKVSAHLWYLDTGCTNHMCGQKEAFSELDESFQDTVRFGNNSVVSSKGKGKLQEKGYELNIKGGVCKIRDPRSRLIAQISMSSN